MSKPTPGPWSDPLPYGEHDLEITGNHRSIAIVRAARRQEDLRVVCDGWTAEDMANGRLISAAPDMAKALREIRSQIHNLPRSATADKIEKLASDALAKAGG